MTIRDDLAKGMFVDALDDLAEYYRARRRMHERTLDTEPEGAA